MWARRRILPIIAAALGLGGLVFFSVSPGLRMAREGLLQAALPALGGLRTFAGRLAALGGGGAGERLAALEAERTRLLAELALREGDRRENELLRRALSLREEGEAGVLPARIMATFREGRDEFLLLDRGTADGIGVGDLVLSREGALGGTVLAVSPRSARVILLTSPSRSTDVSIPARGLRAIARGANARELIVELVPPSVPLAPGDLVVASPRAARGSRSLLVGEVREVEDPPQEAFKVVRALALFDPAADDVLVLLAP